MTGAGGGGAGGDQDVELQPVFAETCRVVIAVGCVETYPQTVRAPLVR